MGEITMYKYVEGQGEAQIYNFVSTLSIKDEWIYFMGMNRHGVYSASILIPSIQYQLFTVRKSSSCIYSSPSELHG